MIPSNPTEQIDSPKVEKRLPKTLAAKEIAELLQAPFEEIHPNTYVILLYSICYMQLACEFRRLFSFKWKMSIWRKRCLLVTAREGDGRSREVPLEA